MTNHARMCFNRGMDLQPVTEQVKIGPEFFKNELREYSNCHWAFARELMQNAMDARSKSINIAVRTDATGNTEVNVTDDGCGMTADVLRNKFLTLGATGKGFQGTVGGFGKAKTLLAFCHKGYSIQTLGNRVDGCGAQYTVTPTTYRQGTSFTVVWNGDCTRQLAEAFERFVRYSQWSGRITLNGQTVTDSLSRGTFKKEFAFGKVYTSKTYTNLAVVRIQGIPMFYQYINYNGCIVVELTGSSLNVLTANRDGLQWTHREEFGKFLQALAVDRRSALRTGTVTVQKFAGQVFQVQVAASSRPATAAAVPVPGALEMAKDAIERGALAVSSGITETTINGTNIDGSRLSFQFILKNSTGMEVPNYFTPRSKEWSGYSDSLITMWARVLTTLHRMFGNSNPFSVGFILDEESEAEHEHGGKFGTVYYINPAKVVKQASGSRSFKKRYKLTDRHEILATAVHEFVHGLGYGQHDEDFTSKFTNVIAVVMRRMKEFNKCFK